MIHKQLFKILHVVTISFILLLSIDSIPVLAAPDCVAEDVVAISSKAWRYKREIIIENHGGKSEDAVIQIQLDKKGFDYRSANSNGSDIRFSTTSGEWKDEGFSYWIEQWNDSGFSRIWIKVPLLKKNSKTHFYMHYGNPDATSVSNGHTTFLFFDDFEDGDYSKKWNNTSVGEVVSQEGQLKLKETDGQDGTIMANFNITGKMIIRTLYQRERGDGHWTRAGIGGWNNWLCVGDHTDNAASGTNYVMLFDSASVTSLKTAPLAKMSNGIITDKWRRVAYWYDGKMLKGMQDDMVVESPTPNATSKLALRTLDNDSWDNFEFITVSKYVNIDSFISIGQEVDNKQ